MRFELVYRNAGIRNLNQFINPPFKKVSDFNMIKHYINHILPNNCGKDGPTTAEPLTYDLIQKRALIFIDHVTEIRKALGEPLIQRSRGVKFISGYHKRNRIFRVLKRANSTVTNPNASILVSYTSLSNVYRYSKRKIGTYWKEANIYIALNETIEKYQKLTNLPQFIECEIPIKVRSLQEYTTILKRRVTSSVVEIDISEYWTFSVIRYLLDIKSDGFDFFKPNRDVVYYWNLNDELVFLSNEKFEEFKEKDSKQFARLFINFLKMINDRQKAEDDEISDLETEEADASEPIENEITRLTKSMAEEGLIGEKARERFLKLSESYKVIPNPSGEGTLEKLIEDPTEGQISLDNEKLLSSETIIDKSMETSSLTNFDSKYAEELYQKDIARMVVNFQRAGIAVTNYEVNRKRDAVTDAFVYKIQFTPVNGSPSTVQFQLPKINKDGTFLANNVKNRMDKQRGDMPIRKIKPDKVSLTSYYGKIFINRDSKAVNDYGRWAVKNILRLEEDEQSGVTKVMSGDVFDSDFKAPRAYSAIAMRIEQFKYKNITFNFNHKSRDTFIGKYKRNDIEKGNRVICGKIGKEPITMDMKNRIYVYNGDSHLLGDLDDVLDNKLGKGPIEFATMVNMGKVLSVGLVLGYKYGIRNLLRKLKAKYRLERGNRILIEEDEYVIKFSDQALIIKNNDSKVNMVMGGFNMYKKDIIDYPYDEFNKKNIYLNILDNHKMTVRYLKEIDLLFQMFIDPITLELLKEMKEPTSLGGLMLRAVELLVTDDHPRETDMSYMRVKGYERLSGMVYYELIRSVRGFLNSPEGKNRKVELNPRAVWFNVIGDASISQVNETNPIQNLREIEKISYSGAGGRDSKTMVRRTREFHPNDRGVISESSTDNSKVGVITYLTADPILKSLRGNSRTFDSDDGVTCQTSSSFLLSPSADKDEGKRVNFIGIQYAHTIAIEGNEIQPIRTGYESVIAHRAGDLYSGIAKKAGVIKEVKENVLIVKYSDGEEDKFKLGRSIVKTPGMNLVHELITDRAKGYRFEANEVLSFNKGFFKRDIFNNKEVCFLMGAVAKVALMESTDTLEDSCAISSEFSKRLITERTQVRNIILNFEQSVRELVSVGDAVMIDSPLCYIEDSVTSDSSLFDEETIKSLDILSANVPKAKYAGVIEDIKIIYYGEIDDMNANLAKLARKFDRLKGKEVEELGLDEPTNNKINDSMRIELNNINEKTFVIQVYITSKETMNTGDKGVFANQLKTTVGRVMTGVNETESGIPVDAIFGFKSIANRVVLSPQINGTNSGALKLISDKAADIYFN